MFACTEDAFCHKMEGVSPVTAGAYCGKVRVADGAYYPSIVDLFLLGQDSHAKYGIHLKYHVFESKDHAAEFFHTCYEMELPPITSTASDETEDDHTTMWYMIIIFTTFVKYHCVRHCNAITEHGHTC